MKLVFWVLTLRFPDRYNDISHNYVVTKGINTFIPSSIIPDNRLVDEPKNLKEIIPSSAVSVDHPYIFFMGLSSSAAVSPSSSYVSTENESLIQFLLESEIGKYASNLSNVVR